jgi:predicted Rossmann-fold nucleotide-binding protein
MGAVAEGALAEGGEVYGVIPEVLQIKERAHPG